MTTLKRRSSTPVKRKAPADHEVRCAVLNASQVSMSPIARIVRLAEDAHAANDKGVLTGLLKALEVLTGLQSRELLRQLELPVD